jgi:hypothetical protein
VQTIQKLPDSIPDHDGPRRVKNEANEHASSASTVTMGADGPEAAR